MASEKEQEQQQQQQQQQQDQQNQASQQASPVNQGNNQQQASPQAQPQQPENNSEQPPAQQQQQQQQTTRQPRPVVHKPDYEKDVVYLYQFTRSPTTPSVSPFCLKVETWLRVTGLKYENVDHRLKHKSKKGQLPFVEVNGNEIADSTVIIRELGKQFNRDLDATLNAEQKSISHAFATMLDNHTSWVYRWWRYNHPSDFLKSSKMNLQHLLNSRIPAPILSFFFKLKLKGKKKSTICHGIGVHSADEIYEFGKTDLLALNELLGDKSFFFGDEASLLDCVAFSHLVQILSVTEVEFPLKGFVESECDHLVQHVERMKDRFWPDWDEICKTLELNTHLPKKQPEGEVKENKEADNKEKPGSPDDKDKESEPEKEKLEQDEKEKEKEEDEGDNKQKEVMEEKAANEENKKDEEKK